MYLKRLEIQGFKSFPSRMAFELGTGVTAVIGPNGSGKSNVADAIRWVLGEQNPRAMRLRKLEDALFAGGHKRAPAGFAEVSMWLDNADGWLPLDFAEVVVSRRLHRSGDTEYLLNRRRVRLRDINELFLKARLGQNSYAIMGQGLVDQVLSLKPEERRALIEEAAEIRRYRVKIEEAQDRLAATQENLEKVDLLVAEIAPRLTQLEKQARRAREHEELARGLAEALHAWYGYQWRTREEALVAARAAYDQRNTAFAAAQADLDQLDGRLTEVRGRLTDQRRAVRVAEETLRRLDDESRAAGGRRRMEEERLGFVRRRLEELEVELRVQEGERQELKAAGQGAAPAETDLADARRTLAGRVRALQAFDAEQEAVRGAGAEAEGALRRRRSELRDAEERLGRLDQDLRSVESDGNGAGHHAALLGRLAEFGRCYQAARQALAVAEAQAAEAENQRETAMRGLDLAREQAAALERSVASARAQAQEHTRRYELLERMRDQLRGVDGAARALVDESGRRTDLPILGLLGELLRVPRGMEAAIEAALAEYVTAVVVPGRREAWTALQTLEERSAGRATIIPLDGLRLSAAVNLREERGVVGVAARFVRCDARYRDLVDTLLGRFIVVEDVETGQALLRRGLGAVVTRDGIVMRPNGTLTGGRGAGDGGRFSLDRELAEIPPLIDRALAEQERCETELADARRTVEEWRTSAREWGEEAERTRRALGRARDTLAAERAALAPVRGDLRELRRRQESAARRVAELRHERESLAGRLAPLQVALGEAERAAAAARRRAEQAASERERLAGAAADGRGVVAALEREQQAVAAVRESRRAALARLEERIAARAREAEGRRREIAQVEADIARLIGEITTAGEARARAEAEAAPAHDRLRSLTRELEELEPLHAARRTALADLERACLNAEGDLHRRAQEIERLRDEIGAEGIDLRTYPPPPSLKGGGAPACDGAEPAAVTQQAPADQAKPSSDLTVHPLPFTEGGREVRSDEGGWGDRSAQPEPLALTPAVVEVDPDELQQRIRSLRARIRSLGPVNAQAEADYAESKERYDFLTTQMADLQGAEAGLREALDELRRMIRERFRTAFQQVGADFQEYFKTFFGGGTARLVLTEPEDYGESGVDIIARPPGKRLQSLQLLSGGERSMTAVALLFALLQSNPAPFCVLDEVDAALDESNVGRFGDALKGLAQRTQFIVITHNRLTIQTADTIYGVSMGADGASSMLSLRLADIPE